MPITPDPKLGRYEVRAKMARAAVRCILRGTQSSIRMFLQVFLLGSYLFNTHTVAGVWQEKI
jgi:hypothetical protein